MELADSLKPLDIDELKLAASAANGQIENVFLHWTAGHYHHIYSDYHLNIDADGRIYAPYDHLDFLKKRNHTWTRNTGSVGIALCCCDGAVANDGLNADLGSEPPTENQIEAMAVVVAILCKYAGVDIKNVYTHCEIAYIDGYGPYSGDPETRWDLWYLTDYDGKLRGGGEVIRGKAQWYMNQI